MRSPSAVIHSKRSCTRIAGRPGDGTMPYHMAIVLQHVADVQRHHLMLFRVPISVHSSSLFTFTGKEHVAGHCSWRLRGARAFRCASLTGHCRRRVRAPHRAQRTCAPSPPSSFPNAATFQRRSARTVLHQEAAISPDAAAHRRRRRAHRSPSRRIAEGQLPPIVVVRFRRQSGRRGPNPGSAAPPSAPGVADRGARARAPARPSPAAASVARHRRSSRAARSAAGRRPAAPSSTSPPGRGPRAGCEAPGSQGAASPIAGRPRQPRRASPDDTSARARAASAYARRASALPTARTPPPAPPSPPPHRRGRGSSAPNGTTAPRARPSELPATLTRCSGCLDAEGSAADQAGSWWPCCSLSRHQDCDVQLTSSPATLLLAGCSSAPFSSGARPPEAHHEKSQRLCGLLAETCVIWFVLLGSSAPRFAAGALSSPALAVTALTSTTCPASTLLRHKSSLTRAARPRSAAGPTPGRRYAAHCCTVSAATVIRRAAGCITLPL